MAEDQLTFDFEPMLEMPPLATRKRNQLVCL
jgi:hypothetical protein